jgi:hypothetical protein
MNERPPEMQMSFTAKNASVAVLDGNWLEEGSHYVDLSVTLTRQEVSAEKT